ncbi:MAG: hypothetical protein KC910_10415 [Candidatus Eremiobacteraeota bacterium]|nr:hypothetical protein [Candidatus Eremiobacteraeota bacterium]
MKHRTLWLVALLALMALASPPLASGPSPTPPLTVLLSRRAPAPEQPAAVAVERPGHRGQPLGWSD